MAEHAILFVLHNRDLRDSRLELCSNGPSQAVSRIPGEGFFYMGKHRRKKPDFSFLAQECCPHCGGTELRKDGIQCGKQRRRCHGCGRTFVPTTGTMLSKTRKRQEKWEGSAVEFTDDATLIASHEYGSINKNTAHLRRLKILKCLGRLVSETVMSGAVWIDEAYFNVPEKSKIARSDGFFLRGISPEQGLRGAGRRLLGEGLRLRHGNREAGIGDDPRGTQGTRRAGISHCPRPVPRS
jgi:transposase-like protein